MRNTVKILGIDIDNIDIQEAGEITKKLVNESNKSCKIIVAPNTEFIMMAQKDEEFYNIFNNRYSRCNNYDNTWYKWNCCNDAIRNL